MFLLKRCGLTAVFATPPPRNRPPGCGLTVFFLLLLRHGTDLIQRMQVRVQALEALPARAAVDVGWPPLQVACMVMPSQRPCHHLALVVLNPGPESAAAGVSAAPRRPNQPLPLPELPLQVFLQYHDRGRSGRSPVSARGC